jgi:cell division protein FtsN
MNHTEKSYLEIKVTFQHILILLAGVILIGSFLFYLGYQAGKSSDKKSLQQDQLVKGEDNSQAIEITSESDPDKIEEDQEPSISEEIKLHQQPGRKAVLKTPKPLKKEPYYTIQVAAFENHSLAKNYSEKFSRAGYPTSISQATVRGKTWYRVRIGHYETSDAAVIEKRKLEKVENKKFNVVKTK